MMYFNIYKVIVLCITKTDNDVTSNGNATVTKDHSLGISNTNNENDDWLCRDTTVTQSLCLILRQFRNHV